MRMARSVEARYDPGKETRLEVLSELGQPTLYYLEADEPGLVGDRRFLGGRRNQFVN